MDVVNRAATALRMGTSMLLRSQTYLGAPYRRLRSKLGALKAITAMSHSACPTGLSDAEVWSAVRQRRGILRAKKPPTANRVRQKESRPTRPAGHTSPCLKLSLKKFLEKLGRTAHRRMPAGRGIMGEITIRQPQASFFFPQSQVHHQYAFERGPDVRMLFLNAWKQLRASRSEGPVPRQKRRAFAPSPPNNLEIADAD